MLRELWNDIKAERPLVHSPAHFKARLPETDDDVDSQVDTADFPSGEIESISGYSCIIRYVDAKGAHSERRVTFHRFEESKGQKYLRAYCHERSAARSFMAERVAAVIDLHTGEIWEPGALFFDRFTRQIEYTSGLSWGMSVQARADLIAGLNALTFMARCDKEFHSSEASVIEQFVTAFWMRREFPNDPPIAEILHYAERLKPDPEMFFIALTRFSNAPDLGRLVKRYLQALVDADGVIRPEEAFWGGKVDNYLSL